MPDNETLKHDVRRGEIIWLLKADYPHLVTFRMIKLALRDRNVPLSDADLFSYLSYLEEAGFIRCKREYNEGESQEFIAAAALSVRGMLLYDRKISDPGVRL